MCYKYRDDYCVKLPGPDLPQNGFFGSMLAADDYDLFTCAPHAFLESYGTVKPSGKKEYTTGACYKMNHNQFEVEAMFNMSSLGSNQYGNRFAGAYNKWYRGSVYGVSGTVMDRALVIGAPLQKDKVTLKTTDIYSGTVVMIDKKKIFEVDPAKTNFALKKEEGQTGVIHKLAGESVNSGVFTSDGTSQVIIGAPKANFLHGKVYICGDCFKPGQRRNVDFPDGKNMEVTGDNVGERFGKAATGCDLTGDGIDDLIVGAPFSATSVYAFDTGKIYIYVMAGNKLEKGVPATIAPGQDYNGGRFGNSIECLGDIDNDAFEDILVGAPYYQQQGAVFLFYGSNTGIQIERKPQIILAKDIQFKPLGFGFSIESVSGDMIAIGAHLSNQVTLLQARKVVRFQPKSKIFSRKTKIDMSKGKEDDIIRVQCLIRFSDSKDPAPANLSLQLTFNVDKRLKPIPSKMFQVTEDQFPNIEEHFNFEAIETSFGYDFDNLREFPLPIKIQGIVQWTIDADDECKGKLSPAKCPMLDPKDKILHTEFLSLSIPFSGSCSDIGCQCMLQMFLGTTFYSVVAGAEDALETDMITIINVGSEVAYGIDITVNISNNVDIPVNIEGCDRADKTRFTCPAIKALDRLQFQVVFDLPEDMEEKDLTARIEVEHKCVNQQQQENLPTQLDIKLHVEKRHQLIMSALKDLSNTFVSVKKKDTSVVFNHAYEIENMGPSMMKSLEFYAAVERENVTLSQPTFKGADCHEVPGKDLADVAKQSLIGRYWNNWENCSFFKCQTKEIAKGNNITLNIEMAVEDRNMFDIIPAFTPSVQSSILVIPDEEISTKKGSSKLTSLKSEFLQIIRNSKISSSIVPELSTNYLMIGKETENFEFFHTYKVRNEGPSSLADLDFSLAVTALDVNEFSVEVIDRDCRASDGNNPETETSTCPDTEKCAFYVCNTGRIQKNEDQFLKIKISVTNLETNLEEQSRKLIQSALTIPNMIDDENEDYSTKTVYFMTDFSQHTIVQKIIDHWYVGIGIVIGLIIICITVAVLFKFDVFNRVRIYREEIDIIHSARNSIMRNSEPVIGEENRNVFVNRDIDLDDEKSNSNNMEMKEMKIENT